MVRRLDNQESPKKARISDFETSFVYPLPLGEEQVLSRLLVDIEELHDCPITKPLPTTDQRDWLPKPLPEPGVGVSEDPVTMFERAVPDLPKPKAPRRVTKQAVDSQSTRKEVEQGGSSGAALSKTQKKNIKKRQKNLKKRQRIRQSTAAAEQTEESTAAAVIFERSDGPSAWLIQWHIRNC